MRCFCMIRSSMKFSLSVLAAILVVSSQLAFSEEPDTRGKKSDEQLGERAQKINNLSTEGQLKLRAAQVKAAEDRRYGPHWQSATKRSKNFGKPMHDSMVKSDPKSGSNPAEDRRGHRPRVLSERIFSLRQFSQASR